MATTWQQNYQLYKRYARNLSLMYQKRQDIRAFTELLLSVATIIIFAIFAIRPTLVTIGSLRADIGGKRETLEKINAKISALAQAQEIYDQNREAILLVDSAVPGSPFPEVYARQIEGLANRYGVFIVSLYTDRVYLLSTTPLETVVEEAPGGAEIEVDSFPPQSASVGFELNITGSFQGINSFLADMENLRRPIFADLLSIRISASDLPGEILLSVTGRLPYSNE